MCRLLRKPEKSPKRILRDQQLWLMSWTLLNRLLLCPAETLVYTSSLPVPSPPRGLCRLMRKAEIWSPKRQLLCKCMAGNPILENNAHSPELVSGHPRDSIVVAVLGPLCCCGEAAVCEQSGYAHHIMQCFSPRAVVFSMEQVTFYRSLVFTQGYHPLRIQAKDSLGNPPGGS